MSHDLASASVIDLPSFGVCASAAPTPKARATRTEIGGLCIDMLDLPFAVDAPARDADVVLVGEQQRRGDRPFGLTPRRYELGAQRLHVAGLVPGPALQDCWPAVPVPWHDEAGEGLVVDWSLQCGLAPALAALGRHHDLGNASGARIRRRRKSCRSRAPSSCGRTRGT